MQIQKKSKNYKKAVLITIIALCAAGVLYGIVARYYTLWPFAVPPLSQTETSTNKPTVVSDNVTNSDSEAEDTSQQTQTNQPANDTKKDVTTPAADIDDNAPYPVTNEHFQIKQISNKNFEITLYPVINNPEYSDYNAQLKAYKQEAQNYLIKRYGSLAGIGIEWSPKDAEPL